MAHGRMVDGSLGMVIAWFKHANPTLHFLPRIINYEPIKINTFQHLLFDSNGFNFKAIINLKLIMPWQKTQTLY
jgi:hypothetical protein